MFVVPAQHNKATLLPVSDYAESGAKVLIFRVLAKCNPIFLCFSLTCLRFWLPLHGFSGIYMCKKFISVGLLSFMMLCASCSSGYRIVGFERSRILVDSVYDAAPDEAAAVFMTPYRQKVDSIMSPVVGRVADYMSAGKPESSLSNLLADILVWCGRDYGESPDFAVYNIGGIRSAFAKGEVTYGDVLDVAPFENKVCFVTLTGDKVTELFGQIAAVGGEGVSHGVELVITGDGRLKSARLNGKGIDPVARYRVATLDYVAQGNDNMSAFKSSADVNSPEGDDNNVRYIIMKYMSEQMARGVAVSAKVEGRIKTEDR